MYQVLAIPRRISVLLFFVLIASMAVPMLSQASVHQSDAQQPPTILVSEVRSWCAADGDCDTADLEFIPGSGQYFDRVRLTPVSGDVPYIGFEVPEGYTATYWDREDTRQTKDATGSETIEAKEAIFTRVS